jgi:hypothetical protein
MGEQSDKATRQRVSALDRAVEAITVVVKGGWLMLLGVIERDLQQLSRRGKY